MNQFHFIRLDADNVGDKIEYLLLEGNIIEANRVHLSIQNSIKELVKTITKTPGYEILMVGCDDILMKVNSKLIDIKFLDGINDHFFQETGFTLSIGIGLNINEAMLNLRKAKLLGKNRIIMNS